MKRGTPGRSLTLFAAGFLLLDAVLLVLAGVWMDRVALIVWGVLFGGATVGVIVLWRRYLRRLDELDEARAAFRLEADRLSRAVHDSQR